MGLKEGGLRGSLRNVSKSFQTIDNLEPEYYEDIGNTLSTYYDGSLGSSTRVQNSSVAPEGEYYLELSVGPDDSGILSHEGDGLNRYPTSADTFAARVNPQGQDAGVFFGVEDGVSYSGSATDAYRLLIRANSDAILLQSGDGSGFSTLLNTSQTINNEWYDIHVDRGDTINIEIFDSSGTGVFTDSVTDSSHTSANGFGWVANNDTSSFTAYLDNARVV